MRCADHIVHLEKGMIAGGLSFKYIQGGTVDLAALQGLYQGLFIYNPAAGTMDEHDPGLHLGKGLGIQKMVGRLV